MKVLWSTFIVFPEVAKRVGMQALYACTWVRAMAEKLRYRDDMQLAIVTVGKGEKVEVIESNGIYFYFLPGGKKVYRSGGGEKVKEAWSQIVEDFKPDVIHVYGTEYAHNRMLVELKPDVPILVSLQGILKDYQKDYYGGMDIATAFRYTSLRDIARGSGIIMDKLRLKKVIKLECEMLQQTDYVEGRTFWDKASVEAINPNAQYYYCPRMIRHEFYASEGWNIDQIERHAVFVHQGFKPLKGLHFVLHAIAVLRQKYPDIKLYIAGSDRLRIKSRKERLMANGYKIYVNDLIKKLKLEDVVEFTGTLDATGLVQQLQKTHVMVLPSSIENSPNSLVEAMMVGTPCIASFVGGIPGMLKHEEEGLLYCYNEVNVLIHYIDQIFRSDEVAKKYSNAARIRKMEEHAEEKLVERLINIYQDIIHCRN